MPAEGARATDSHKPFESSSDASAWLQRYGDALYRYAAARVGGREPAEDLVQETFLAALQSRDRFQHRSSVRTWLFSILRHKIVDHYRRGQGGREVTAAAADADAEADTDEALKRFFTTDGLWSKAPSPWKGPEQALERNEFWGVLDGCLGGLPRSLAQAFVLRELEEVDSERLCELLGLSPGNLRVRLHRARLLLRDCLEKRWFGSRSEDAPRTP
jgi:RNA polymerase sigma-70 factor (ECF subfamily)